MKKWMLFCLCFWLTIVWSQEKRAALIIGNNQYKNWGKLPAVESDVKIMEQALKKVNFEIYQDRCQMDLSFEQMKKTLEGFQIELTKTNPSVVLVYYAGHGVEVNGKQYLLPIDMAKSLDGVMENSIGKQLLEKILKPNRVNILIINACRVEISENSSSLEGNKLPAQDSAFFKKLLQYIYDDYRLKAIINRNNSLNLQPVEGTFTIYTTSSGQPAQDSNTFSNLFEKYVDGDAPLTSMIPKIREDLKKSNTSTEGEQSLQYHDGLNNSSNFYFRRPLEIKWENIPSPCKGYVELSVNVYPEPKELFFTVNGNKLGQGKQKGDNRWNCTWNITNRYCMLKAHAFRKEDGKEYIASYELNSGKMNFYNINCKISGEVYNYGFFSSQESYEENLTVSTPEDVTWKKTVGDITLGFNQPWETWIDTQNTATLKTEIYLMEKDKIVKTMPVSFTAKDGKISEISYKISDNSNWATIKFEGEIVSILDACKYQHDGEWILDMTKDIWMALPTRKQRECASVYQLNYAQEKGLQVEKTVSKKNVSFIFRLIPPGRFYMGDKQRVIISEAFWMQKTEITQKQWEAVTGKKPWLANEDAKKYVKDNEEYPAVYISWNDIKDTFLHRLGSQFDLPTEAQWEYAYRSGTISQYYWGESKNEIEKYANCCDLMAKESGKYPSGWNFEENARDEYEFVAPVGKLNANAYGLHDMAGNVWEWCKDKYEDYPSGNIEDSCCPHVVRGGSCFLTAIYCQADSRKGCRDTGNGVGARLCMKVAK